MPTPHDSTVWHVGRLALHGDVAGDARAAGDADHREILARADLQASSEEGVRLAQKVQVGPYIPQGIQQ